MKWITVTRKSPCPICKKPDWCGVSDDGRMCICMRAQNDAPTKNGGFLWVYEHGRWDEPSRRAQTPFNGASRQGGYTLPLPPPKAPQNAPKWARSRLPAKEVVQFIQKDMETIHDWDYGVREICGEDGFFECGTACSFGMYESKSHPYCVGIPMRDAGGEIVGVRFRNTLTKAKSSLLGGRDGLFFAPIIFKRKVDTLLIVEGATDAIALASLGFDVVGRSSCSTGKDLIRELLNIVKPRNLVYVADVDHAKQIAGRLREAGREGVMKLAKEIKRPHKIIHPPNAKDIREYILAQRARGAKTPQIYASIARLIKDSTLRL